jgi:hypothetical protein
MRNFLTIGVGDKIHPHGAFVFGEVPVDDCQIETAENTGVGLSLKQELKGFFHQRFR